MNLRTAIPVMLIGMMLNGCLLRAEEEHESSGFLVAGQLELTSYPAASQGLTDRLIVPRPGEPVIIEEELTEDDATWSRPDRNCQVLDENDFPFDTFQLTNHLDQEASVNITVQPVMGETPLAIPMVYAYEDEDEIPRDELTCTTSGQSRVVFALAPRTSYLIVVSSWDNDETEAAFGEYTVTFMRQ